MGAILVLVVVEVLNVPARLVLDVWSGVLAGCVNGIVIDDHGVKASLSLANALLLWR